MSLETKKLTCPFFLASSCNFNDESCLFSHDLHGSVRIPAQACFFYLRGDCNKGDDCLRRHMTIDEIVDDLVPAKVETIASSPPLSYQATVRLQQPQEEEQELKPSKSYAFAASSSSNHRDPQEMAKLEVCTLFEANGYCNLPTCFNVHGDMCDLCGFYSIHPHNAILREKHRKECTEEHEKQMEASFAYQRSKELTCGICLDVIMDKESPNTSRFGLLENCVHVYCIECIRTWRKSNFDKVNKRSCPQCRVKSDFIIPSEYYYEDGKDKAKIIATYKNALSDKDCKYFKRGQGKCPFLGACFYKHAYPDGRKAEMPMPKDRTTSRSFNDDPYFIMLDSVFVVEDFDDFEVYLSDN